MILRKRHACRDKSARTPGPRRAARQRIAATRADRAVITALKNEGGGVLERAAVDANLKHAAVKAILKGVIVAESKNAVLEGRDRHRRRSESLVADTSWIINPRSVW
jgi:phage terminase large subunit-like protein